MCKGSAQDIFYLFQCISQFHLRPPPSPGYCGVFARLVSPGGGAFVHFALPGGGAFANPQAIPELLTRTGFLSEYNYTEGFTVKAVWLICQRHE